MQPYVNPYYLQQPYQNYPQYPLKTGISGKIVNEMNQITANDVPMDGSVAFFPRQDLSEVYAKSWNADGTIRTMTYKPVFNTDMNKPSSDTERAKLDLPEELTEGIMKRFDELSNKIEQLEKSLLPKKPQRKDEQS